METRCVWRQFYTRGARYGEECGPEPDYVIARLEE
jgi:hypothetical protein